MSGMTTNKPYMVRAIHEWINDNRCTPYVVVMASYPGVSVPQAFVKDDQITLNISPSAVRELVIGNDSLEFYARFGGVPTQIVVPIGAIMAIFAKENGQGMGFEVDVPPPEPPTDSDESVDSASKSQRPSLKIVK
ncbi:MAG: ClpXP protease specificity-enhancing factor [Reinekea sp.]|jgi:stringent starvation protein B